MELLQHFFRNISALLNYTVNKMSAFFDYAHFIIILIFAISFAISSPTAGLLLLTLALLVLPPIRKKMAAANRAYPKPSGRITFIAILIAAILAGNADRKKNELENAERQEKQEITRAEIQESWRKEFSENPEKTLEKITTLIDEGSYKSAQDMISYLSSLSLTGVTMSDETIKKSLQLKSEYLEQKKTLAQREIEEKERQDDIRLAGSWIVHKEKIPTDGSESISVSKPAIGSVPILSFNARPQLHIRCHKNRTEVFMELGADFKPVNGNHDQAQIRYQIDDKRIISEIWKEDANIDAAFAPSSVELSRAMKGAKKISMEFYPFYGYGPSSTAEFDLRGLAPHLSEIAKACGWPL